jgi:hypothetical protein
MFKSLVIVAAALVAAVSADISSFPSFDALHANCAMKALYPGEACATTYANMRKVITSWKGGDPGKGLYDIKEEKENTYIWVTRTTPVKRYVDDIAFEFSTTGSGCQVSSRSRSQSLSYYDYSTNYCNMWNPIKYTGSFQGLVVSDCKFPTDDPATTCNIY